MKITKILVPTDFSSYAETAMHYALDLAQDYAAEVLLLHVIPERDLRAIFDYPLGFPLEQVLHEYQDKVEQHCAQVAAQAQQQGTPVTPLVSFGVPYEKIIQAAKDHHVDLLIMATHGRTGLSHAVLGSVAERVVRLAPCPVVTIKSTMYTAER
jgi:nucleotide-binding universal stress UspA family protein